MNWRRSPISRASERTIAEDGERKYRVEKWICGGTLMQYGIAAERVNENICRSAKHRYAVGNERWRSWW